MNKKTTKRALVMSALSLLLCISMLIGTTYAWFTDSVTSGNNIIKSGTLDVEMTYADKMEAPEADWANAEDGSIFNYELWEPGFTQVKYVNIANVGNLAFKYQVDVLPNMAPAAGEVNLADVIDVYFVDAPTASAADFAEIKANWVKAGVLSDLMGTGTTGGILLPEAGKGSANVEPSTAPVGNVTVGIALHMQETAGNEYQNLEVTGGFKVRLMATQYTYEKDSFDHQYDKDALYGTDKPLADVSRIAEKDLPTNISLYNLSNLSSAGVQADLDIGFTFKATETPEEAAQSEYAAWHADFAVSFDGDIPTGTAGLAGQYSFWSLDWLGFPSFDVDPHDGVDGIPGGKEFRLLKDSKGIYMDYATLCKDVKDFNCGVYSNDPVNNGKTITVKLNLYETYTEEECYEKFGFTSVNEETGEFKTIATYTYTFND